MKLIGNLYQTKGRWYWKVTLPQETKRRTIALKPLGSRYATTDKKVAEECAKRILEEHLQSFKPDRDTVRTIAYLCVLYRNHVQGYYAGSTEAKNIGYAIAYLEKHCPDLPVDDFDSLKLMEIRDCMIDDGSCRNTINRRTSMIKRMFKWADQQRYCSTVLYQNLQSVENLKMGRSQAKESKKVKAISIRHVEAVLPHLSDVVASMVQLQLITGMRSTELCLMRPCDIDRSDEVWLYRPSIFKGQHREGYIRIIALGKQSQEILSSYLLNKEQTSKEYLFKPEDGAGAKKHRQYNLHYTKDSYGLAIRRKIKILNRDIKKDCLNEAEYESRKIQPWTPHQLRHTFATIRSIARTVHSNPERTAYPSVGYKKSEVAIDVQSTRVQTSVRN